MQYITTFFLLFISHIIYGQNISTISNIINIEVWRDSILNSTDSIKLIQIKSPDTLIAIPLRDIRSINKISEWDRREHELILVLNYDTMHFSFRKNLEDYISGHSPVAQWTIRMFTDMKYAKQFYRGTVSSNEVSKYKKFYSFTCDWCDEELFNPK